MNATCRTSALTAVAPLAPRRLLWCRLVLPVLRILATSSALARLRILHFGGWIVFGDVSGPRDPGGWRARPSMVFLSDYDGDPVEYLAAFGIVVAPGMRWSFGSAEGFPGTRPTRRFIEFVDQHRTVEHLRYSAYPGATVRDIDAAFAVADRWADLRRVEAADDMPPARRSGVRPDESRFATAYHALLDALALAPEPDVPSLPVALWRALFRRATVGGLAMVVPIAPGRTPEVVAALGTLAAASPAVFDQVAGTHFARLAVVPVAGRAEAGSRPADHLLLCAWHDGSVDDYVGALVAGLGPACDDIWGRCTGYPGRADPRALAGWLKEHRLRFSLFLGSRSGRSVQQIRDVLALRERVFEAVVARHGPSTVDVRRELRRLWT